MFLIISSQTLLKTLKAQSSLIVKTFIDNIEGKTLRAVFKYKNHPSIIDIQNKIKNAETFYFTELNITGIEKKSRS